MQVAIFRQQSLNFEHNGSKATKEMPENVPSFRILDLVLLRNLTQRTQKFDPDPRRDHHVLTRKKSQSITRKWRIL